MEGERDSDHEPKEAPRMGRPALVDPLLLTAELGVDTKKLVGRQGLGVPFGVGARAEEGGSARTDGKCSLSKSTAG